MAPASNDEQFKFLISCIRYSDNGKVDFEEVRKECDIVSKGAAAKRYERMMKAHGIHQSQSTGATIYNAPVTSRNKATPVTGAGKKRKINHLTEDSLNRDDDEELFAVKTEKAKVKTERPNKKIKMENKNNATKHEAPGLSEDLKEEQYSAGVPVSVDEIKKPSLSCFGLDGTDDTCMKDFMAFGASVDMAKGTQSDMEGPIKKALTELDTTAIKHEGLDLRESIVIAD